MGTDISAVRNVDLRIVDLAGATPGLATGSTIYLDGNAAGWGWYVDANPKDNREFIRPGNQGEQDRVDLLTAVMHELGHVLGHDHDEDGVMIDTLAAGVRRTGLNHENVTLVDQVFRQSGDHRAEA